MSEANIKDKPSDDDFFTRAFGNIPFAKWDYENVLATAMRESKLEGKLEGRLEGELKAKLETAREMKAAGLSISQIAQFTKLSIEEINKL
ncbi:putative transposase/invertase (TIGR01784 family) [Arcticibacter tournemirensis]|nr:putative transposase/invertase (TIGR01784 family) [Arcticibacter tournemirensis]